MRSPWRKSRCLSQDLVFLFKPPILAFQALHLRLLGLALSQRFSRSGRKLFNTPGAELAGAQPKFSGNVRQTTSVQHTFDRLRFELRRKSSPATVPCHDILRG
jgi:hypothetical protein